ncbi:MAG: alginate export family protein [Marinicaulis sp.]|nr:alginate export family protein [Marinicaulis sp.]
MFRKYMIATIATTALFTTASAEENNTPPPERDNEIIAPITNGKPIIDIRYRFEFKGQESFVENAYANTVRTRLGFETGEVYNLKALVEFENVFNIGGDHFNSTTNGLTQFPVIADPDATEINRAQVTFTGIEKTPITIGRQRYNLNNHRFVGAVDWRQNQQTFDAARIASSLIDNVALDYVYISRVHRIFGDDHPLGEFDSDSHLVSAAINGGELGMLKGYGVLLDLMDAPALSSNSWGVRYEKTFPIDEKDNVALSVVGEYASQSDAASNPVAYRESYIHGEGGIAIGAFAGKIGYEKLGGDGISSFKTPLATLHKFQGFADAFLVTPPEGIQDIYGTLFYHWKKAPYGTSAKLLATFHKFKSDVGGLDFGNEFDASLAISFRENWTAQLKGAVFNGGAFGPADRYLFWASLRFQY